MKLSNTAKLLISRMRSQLSVRGAVAEFCRKTGFSRTTVDSWLDEISAPNVNNLDTIAEALGVQPWELLKPEDAEASPDPAAQANAEILELIKGLLTASPTKRKVIRAALSGVSVPRTPKAQSED